MSLYKQMNRRDLWNADWPAGTSLTIDGIQGEGATLGEAYLEDGVAVVDVAMPETTITARLDQCHPVWPNAK